MNEAQQKAVNERIAKVKEEIEKNRDYARELRKANLELELSELESS